MTDLDGLKLINDTLGHEKGDALLVETARVLEEVVRKSDMVARIGGDEFTILLPGADEALMEEIVGRIGAAFEDKLQALRSQALHKVAEQSSRKIRRLHGARKGPYLLGLSGEGPGGSAENGEEDEDEERQHHRGTHRDRASSNRFFSASAAFHSGAPPRTNFCCTEAEEAEPFSALSFANSRSI